MLTGACFKNNKDKLDSKKKLGNSVYILVMRGITHVFNKIYSHKRNKYLDELEENVGQAITRE